MPGYHRFVAPNLYFLLFLIFHHVDLFQVAKITAQKSKTILTDIERWQKVKRLWAIDHIFFTVCEFAIVLTVIFFCRELQALMVSFSTT